MKQRAQLCKNRRAEESTKYQSWNTLGQIPKTEKAVWLRNSKRGGNVTKGGQKIHKCQVMKGV